MKQAFKKIVNIVSLERLANMAILVTALVAFSLVCINYWVKKGQPIVRNGLSRGQSFPNLPSNDYGSFHGTLVFVLNTHCEYCRVSVPFYKQLIEASRVSPQPVRLVGVFPNDASEVRDYLRTNDLQIAVVSGVDLDKLNIGGTPSLVLVDREGHVKDFWLGKLSPGEELQVMKSIRGS